MLSKVFSGSRVQFPAFLGERVYMREFKKKTGLPVDLKRWQDTVDQMLDGIDSDDSIFLMVDQGKVQNGLTHRRPGVHVDGYWNPAMYAHKGTHGAWREAPGRHGHGHKSHTMSGSNELIVLASNVFGCRAYEGNYSGRIQDDGDCSHIDVRELLPVDMEPNRAWYGDTSSLLHEAIPLNHSCERTVVRLNVRH